MNIFGDIANKRFFQSDLKNVIFLEMLKFCRIYVQKIFFRSDLKKMLFYSKHDFQCDLQPVSFSFKCLYFWTYGPKKDTLKMSSSSNVAIFRNMDKKRYFSCDQNNVLLVEIKRVRAKTRLFHSDHKKTFFYGQKMGFKVISK